MADWLNNLIGLILPDRGVDRDAPAPKPKPRVILGGNAAPELCMLPVEAAMPDWHEAELVRRFGSQERRVIQVKADGINAMCIDGRMVCGRTGADLDCALHCQPGLVRLERAFGHPMVFLGEYVADDGFNATLGEHAAGRGSGVFWLYDAVPYGAWVLGREYEVSIEERLASLKAAFGSSQTGLFVGMLDWWMLTPAETIAKAREVWAAGFEGLVSKKAGSGFARRRDDRWLKVKERHRMACSVIDVLHKDGALQSVILKGPGANIGGKPLRMSVEGASATERGLIEQRNHDGVPMAVEIEFELTTGFERTVRGAKWIRLIGGKESTNA